MEYQFIHIPASKMASAAFLWSLLHFGNDWVSSFFVKMRILFKNSDRKGESKTSTIIEVKTSIIRFTDCCHTGIIFLVITISGVPKIELIFTDPERISYISGITLITTFNPSNSVIILPKLSCSDDSTAIITYSI